MTALFYTRSRPVAHSSRQVSLPIAFTLIAGIVLLFAGLLVKDDFALALPFTLLIALAGAAYFKLTKHLPLKTHKKK